MDFNSVIIGSENPNALVEFYRKVFGKAPDWQGGEFQGFNVGSGLVFVGPHSEVSGKNNQPGRILLGFQVSDVTAETKRLQDAGVTMVQEPYRPDENADMWIATFEDPDGNYFQLTTQP
ncbi:MAG TPA: VOC family protein [Candidatus Saccharimonadales bacterium]|nr:VOC family protein [Candidatus Saccharimonadales bacterium]